MTVPAVGSGYLASAENAAIFIQWLDQHGQVSGSAQVASIDTAVSPESVSSATSSVSGTIQGSTIELSFNGSQDTFGRWSGPSFTINLPSAGLLEPLTFRTATVNDFNQAVSALQTEVSQANQAAAQAAQAQQQTTREEAQIDGTAKTAAADISKLTSTGFASDLTSLAGDVGDVQSALQQEQTDLATFQSDLASNNQFGQACTDLGGSIEATLGGSVEAGVDGAFQPGLGQLTRDIQSVQQTISTAPRDVSTYQRVQEQLPNYRSQYLVGPLGPALAAAQQQIAAAVARANQLVDQVNAIVASGVELANQANTAASCQDPAAAPTPVQHVS